MNGSLTFWGKLVIFPNLEPIERGYEVLVDYRWEIDPVDRRTLIIDFFKDSAIIDIKIKH